MKKFLLSSLIALFSFGSISAQSYSDQVYFQLKSAYSTLREYGNIKLEKTIITNVKDNETDGWTFYLSSHKTYFIVGACDNDCSDLDMYITRENSAYKIEEDNRAGDLPVLSIRPASSGRYTITLKMYSCSESICYQGFSVYSL